MVRLPTTDQGSKVPPKVLQESQGLKILVGKAQIRRRRGKNCRRVEQEQGTQCRRRIQLHVVLLEVEGGEVGAKSFDSNPSG